MNTLEQIQSATLIIWGGNFDPTRVTKFMDVQPSQYWRQGDQKAVMMEDGFVHRFESKNEWSGWKLWLDENARKESLEKQIQLLAGYLPSREVPLMHLREQGAFIAIDCYVNVARSMTFGLSTDLQALLGRFSVSLKFTLSYTAMSQAADSGTVEAR